MEILVCICTSRCLNILNLSLVLAGFIKISDVSVLAVSVPILMRLQTSLWKQIKASALTFWI
jgi:hypothetical protein